MVDIVIGQVRLKLHGEGRVTATLPGGDVVNGNAASILDAADALRELRQVADRIDPTTRKAEGSSPPVASTPTTEETTCSICGTSVSRLGKPLTVQGLAVHVSRVHGVRGTSEPVRRKWARREAGPADAVKAEQTVEAEEAAPAEELDADEGEDAEVIEEVIEEESPCRGVAPHEGDVAEKTCGLCGEHFGRCVRHGGAKPLERDFGAHMAQHRAASSPDRRALVAARGAAVDRTDPPATCKKLSRLNTPCGATVALSEVRTHLREEHDMVVSAAAARTYFEVRP